LRLTGHFGGYAPHNYENDYKAHDHPEWPLPSRAMCRAVKLAARVGIHKVATWPTLRRYLQYSPLLPTALGAAEITLEEQVASYSVFPMTACA